MMFILIPIFEGIRKSRQRRRAEADTAESDDAPIRSRVPPPRTGAGSRPGPRTVGPQPGAQPRPQPADASEMVPDDLWEILTGERRQRPQPPEPAPEPEEVRVEVEEPEERWLELPDERWRDEEPAPERREPDLPQRAVSKPWWDRPEPEPEPAPAPASAETYSPLSRPGRAPVKPRPPRASLRDFTEPAPLPPRQKTPLMRTLQSAEGLRDAVLLREILGPPKGLEL
jgi:hypothetical protein